MNWDQQFVESFITKLVNPRPKYRIEQVSEVGHKVIDTSTNECMWDISNGANVFTLEEAERMINNLQGDAA